MKEIKLTQEKIALIDDEDYDILSAIRWHAWYNKNNDSFYAHHSVYIKGQNPTVIRMHRYLLGVIDPAIHVDHENGNTLDNRKINLRLSTRKQNARNRTHSNKRNTSGYRGVSKTTINDTNPWVAQVRFDGKRVTVGHFATPEEAAIAFDCAAKKYYGEFCGKLNFEESK